MLPEDKRKGTGFHHPRTPQAPLFQCHFGRLRRVDALIVLIACRIVRQEGYRQTIQT